MSKLYDQLKKAAKKLPTTVGARDIKGRKDLRALPFVTIDGETAKDFNDALRIANKVPFGLSASIQSTNVSRVFDFVYGMEAGLLTVNLPSAGVEYQLPFGGSKDSSFGPKEQGPAALEFYSDYKTIYLKY